MIALLRFFQPVEVGSKLLGIRPSGAVDALQHLVTGIAPPVGARQFGQLERPQVTGVRDMRTATHVDVFLVVVQRDFLAFRNLVDDLHLVGLATSLKYFTGPIAGHHFAQHIVILRNQLLYLGLDFFEIFLGEGLFAGNVVVKPVLDHRTHRHLGIRVQLLDRLPQHVCQRMAQNLDALFVAVGDDGNFGVLVDLDAGIHQPPVDPTSQCRLGKARHRCPRRFASPVTGCANSRVEPSGSVTTGTEKLCS